MASRVVSVSSAEAGREVCRPPVAPAWFHAHGQVWVPFSEADNDALEEGWTKCRPALEERAAQTEEVASAPKEDTVGWLPSLLWYSKPATHASVLPPPPPPPAPNLRKTPLVHRRLDPDEDDETKQFRVSVLEDRLFEVDLEKMIIFPALWPGYDQGVMRATWFYVASDGACSPIAWGSALSADLDRVYEEAKPWNLVGRLRASLNVGKAKSDSDAAQLFDLPSVAGGAKVLFDSTSSARVYTSKLLSFLWEPLVVRGYENAKAASVRMQENSASNVIATAWSRRNDASPSTPSDNKKKPEGPTEGTIVEGITPTPVDTMSTWGALSEAFMSRARAFRSGAAPTTPPAQERNADEVLPDPAVLDFSETSSLGALSDDLYADVQSTADLEEREKGEAPPEHIVFCIHGIGQKLTEDYMATHFVHDVERMRTVMRQQMQDPALSAQLSGGRVRLIPICWRHDVEFDPDHGHYKLQDITNNATIPAVRTVISKVLLDIPFYFSSHHEAMLTAVRLETNRLYRLFLQRNPDFEQCGGRVSILGHSLGAALSSDLLKDQPTDVAPLNTSEAPGIHRTSPHLLFNVTHFFSVGSPLPLLYYLSGAELIARRRTDPENPLQADEDVTCNKVGQQGCLATEYVHNIYASTDPCSFQISATVDAAYARLLRPVEVPRDPLMLDRALNQPRLSIGSVMRTWLHPKDKGEKDKQGEEGGKEEEQPEANIQENAREEQHAHDHGEEKKKLEKEVEQDEHGEASVKLGEQGKKEIIIDEARSENSQEPASTPPSSDKETESPSDPTRTPKAPSRTLASPRGETPQPEESKDEKTPPPLTLHELELGERRFQALNPYGCIDFVVDGGTVNQFTQYIDMFRAHMSYWTNPAFSNYLLKQLVPNENVVPTTPYRSPSMHAAQEILDPTTDSV